MSSDKPAVLNERQVELCQSMGIPTEGLNVISENEEMLRLLHHPTRNVLWIDKGEKQKRKERGLW